MKYAPLPNPLRFSISDKADSLRYWLTGAGLAALLVLSACLSKPKPTPADDLPGYHNLAPWHESNQAINPKI